MSDRILLMRDGSFEQAGTPEEIYEHPATRFAAEFIGQTNLLRCRVEQARPDGLLLGYGDARIPARPAEYAAQAGDEVCLSLRTERLRFGTRRLGSCSLEGTLMEKRYAGGSLRATIRLADGHDLLALCASAEWAQGEVGGRVYLSWNPDEAPVVRA